MLRDALDAFVQGEAARAEQVLARDDAVDELYGQIIRDMMSFMQANARRDPRGDPRHPRRQVPRAGGRPRDEHRRRGHLHGPRRGRPTRADAPPKRERTRRRRGPRGGLDSRKPWPRGNLRPNASISQRDVAWSPCKCHGVGVTVGHGTSAGDRRRGRSRRRSSGTTSARRGTRSAWPRRARRGSASRREQRPDIVLLDVMLPDMPGTNVCKTLKQDATTRGSTS